MVRVSPCIRAIRSIKMLSKACHRKLNEMLAKHSLPSDFLTQSESYYASLAQQLFDISKAKKPLFLGIQGLQGSGKSTTAAFVAAILEIEHGLKVAVVSIDDFYLTKVQRYDLDKEFSPLFETRGVPGTHDINLLTAMFDSIEQGQGFDAPVFDKAADDRSNAVNRIEKSVDLLILEGWCVAVSPQALTELELPVNDLERLEDGQQRWRIAVNQNLAGGYAELFNRLDCLVALQAPSFESVYAWRLLQEQKLVADLRANNKSLGNTQSPEQLKRFIAHFERLSRHALKTIPSKVDFLLKLRADHSIEGLSVVKGT